MAIYSGFMNFRIKHAAEIGIDLLSMEGFGYDLFDENFGIIPRVRIKGKLREHVEG